MPAWNNYFHFLTGTTFEIDGPWGYDGHGSVLENSDTELGLRLDLDAWGPAPALHAKLHVIYKQEGPGNLVTMEEDGKPPKQDADARIRSVDARRERGIAAGPITFSVRYDGDDEIDLDLYMNGKSFDFDLTRN